MADEVNRFLWYRCFNLVKEAVKIPTFYAVIDELQATLEFNFFEEPILAGLRGRDSDSTIF